MITDYILNDIKPLDTSGNLGAAQNIFSQTTYSHIPVMQDGIYMGCLAEIDVHCHESTELINEQMHLCEGFFVREGANWLNILEDFGLNGTNLMPVLDDQNRYLGFYELKDVMNYFNKTPFMSNPGAILIIEKGAYDYSFSEISQIVESNEGKLLGAVVSQHEDGIVQISLKVGSDTSLNKIIQTFRRYGYEVVSTHEEDALLIDLRERSDYLEKYLSI